MIQLLTGILLVFSCMGYMLLVRKTLSLPWEFIPLFTFSSIGCLVFFGGLAGQLYTVSLAVMGIGLLASIGIAILWLRQRTPFRFSFSIFQASFLAGSVIFLLVLFRNPLTHYDNFSHWAIVLKMMLSTDAFPTAASDLIDFKNYPLGTSSFLYYVCRFAGHAQTTMLFAQGLLIFSCFYAMFGIVSEKRRFMLYAFLGAGLSMLSFFNITIRITNLLVDFLLPIYALAILAILYRYRHHLKNACMVILPIAGLLTIIKSTGIIFATIGFMYLIYITVTYKSKLGWKYTLLVVGTICGALLPYFGWSWRMATVFQGVANKFASSGLQSAGGGKTPEQVHEIVSLFLKSSIDLATRPAMGIVIFQFAAILASMFAAVMLRKKWNLWKALIALDIVVVLYYTGILGLYVYSMPLDEAIWLAGFERYASSIVVLFVGGLVMCATVDIERSFHYKNGEMPDARAFKSVKTKGFYQNGIWACTVFSVILLLSEYNGILSIANSYKTTLPYKVEQVTGDHWYANGQEDTSKYLLYASDTNQQVTNYYMQYIGKYYLYAPHVDGICLFYEDNMDNLLSGYDYLVVIETDSDAKQLLKKHYGVDMQAGTYRITRSGEQVVLTRQNKT